MTSGEVSAEMRERQFDALRQAQAEALSLTNWHEFLKAVRRAGYRSRAMISSENNLMFSYLMYLIGRGDYKMGRRQLRDVMSQWFFMAALTGRYTGSFESRVEQDLLRVAEAESADDFIHTLEGIIDTALTDDYWSIQLPSALETSAAYGPTVFAYQASLVLLKATPLFSSMDLGDCLDPAMHAPRSGVERHHLFPRGYLTGIGIDQTVRRNQMANYAFLEWPDNASIGDSPPHEYFPELFAELSPEAKRDARFWHALPGGWESMEYDEFLQARRSLIANVVRTACRKLRTGEVGFEDQSGTSIEELLEHMETDRVEFKSSAYYSYRPGVPEKVVTEAVVKTVAGFLNSEGGTLAIGISDDGEILGIQPDLDAKNMDPDRYVNSLTSVIGGSLGSDASTMAKIRLEAVDRNLVALVDAQPSPKPVYATVRGDRIFFVRVNNSTRRLDGPDLVSYVQRHWDR